MSPRKVKPSAIVKEKIANDLAKLEQLRYKNLHTMQHQIDVVKMKDSRTQLKDKKILKANRKSKNMIEEKVE